MTIDATLAALTAGLDRDEAIARAAAELDAEGASWRVRKFRDEGMYVFGDNQSAPPGGKFGFEEDAQTEHIDHFDPKRALCQVEVFQRVLKLHAEAERDSALSDRDAGFEAGVYAALELLASIYTEEEA